MFAHPVRYATSLVLSGKPLSILSRRFVGSGIGSSLVGEGSTFALVNTLVFGIHLTIPLRL